MTCKSCEFTLEREFMKIAGILKVHVSQKSGTAMFTIDKNHVLDLKALKSVIEKAGYHLLEEQHGIETSPEENHRQKWIEIGASLIIIFALYKVLQALDIVSFASSSAAAATFGGVFLIGIVAGTSSCLAVTGGLLLSVAAKYNETHQANTAWQKMRPLLYFNLGRLISYFLLGGLVGILGQSITLTPRMTGYLNVIVALIMLSLALSILKIIPKGSFGFSLPKTLTHRIANLSENKHPLAPFSLGALTFFLPCGFTQSLQLVALASGSFFTGAWTMFVFALGTLPFLLGVSAISSTAKGKTSRLFLRFSGTLVLILAFFNLKNGLLLSGVDAANYLSSLIPAQSSFESESNRNVSIAEDGTQIIRLKVSSYEYSPSVMTIEGGIPTIVEAIADGDVSGCASVLTVPSFGLTKYLRAGTNILGPFTPNKNFILTCSMGMVTSRVKVKNTVVSQNIISPAASIVDIPANAQVAELIWTDRGYQPSLIEVQQGKPTVIRLTATSRAGGCMSTVVFPSFNQSAFLPAPRSEPKYITLATDTVPPGDYPVTCGMGAKMALLRVR